MLIRFRRGPKVQKDPRSFINRFIIPPFPDAEREADERLLALNVEQREVASERVAVLVNESVCTPMLRARIAVHIGDSFSEFNSQTHVQSAIVFVVEYKYGCDNCR